MGQVRGCRGRLCLRPQRVFPWEVLPCFGPPGRCPGTERTVPSHWPLLSSLRTGCTHHALGGRPSCHPCPRAGFPIFAPCRPTPWLAPVFGSGRGGPPCHLGPWLRRERNPCKEDVPRSRPAAGRPPLGVRCHARLAKCAISWRCGGRPGCGLATVGGLPLRCNRSRDPPPCCQCRAGRRRERPPLGSCEGFAIPGEGKWFQPPPRNRRARDQGRGEEALLSGPVVAARGGAPPWEQRQENRPLRARSLLPDRRPPEGEPQ